LQIFQKSIGDLSGSFFQENLAEADDVIDGRAQVVPDLGERPRVFAPAAGACPFFVKLHVF
jgi:hypothetical protein